MKHLKDISESVSLDMVTKLTQIARNPLNLNNYYMMTGETEPVKDGYYDQVKDHCILIAMEYLCVSEKSFDELDRLTDIVSRLIIERQDEFDTIIHNCKSRKFRYQYCAETEFHTIIQGRLDALKERSVLMGGFGKTNQDS